MFGDDKNGKRSDEPDKPDYRWGKPDAPLSQKQLAFVEEYLKDGNATRAAVAAGYSPKRGRETGCELLKDSRIAAIVLSRADELAGNLEATRIEVAAAYQQANELAEAAADQIAVELRGLSSKARTLMTLAEGTGDIRTALQGLREISRLLELKAKLAGRIAGAKVEINLTTVNIDSITDDELGRFLERARERVEKIRARELDELVDESDANRVLEAMLSRAVGRPVKLDEVIEALRDREALPAPELKPEPESPPVLRLAES
jgi:hypothetical protein